MSVADFIVEYITDRTAEGITDPKGICSSALDEISELDKLISKADAARIRRSNLIKVLQQFEHKSVKNVRNSKISPVANMQTAEAVLVGAATDFMVRVCKFIEENEGCTAGDILLAIGDYKKNEETFGSIKALCEKGIILQKDRKLLKGEKWNERESLF